MNRMDAYTSDTQPQVLGSKQDMDLDSLWDAYSVSRDEALRNRLLVHYLPVSRMIARHIHHRVPTAIELDDLAQAAIFGLRGAIATYDRSRGIPFEQYCGPRVRGAVLDHLRSMDWAPRMLRSRVARVREMIQQIEMETGEKPTDEEVSDALQMPLDELQTLRSEMGMPTRMQTAGLEEGSGTGKERGIHLEMVPDRGDFDPLREAQRADLREFVIKGLSEVERQVLIMYYYDAMSLREIGETLELCESRVSQIHHAVIRRLRERMHRIGGESID